MGICLIIKVLHCTSVILRSSGSASALNMHGVSWGASVGHQLASRAEFAGLADVDIACSTHSAHRFSQVDQGLLRVAMNGSFYTRDKQFCSGKFLSKQCPWCPAEDSVYHRTWQCPHFQHVRDQMDPEHRAFIMRQPDCAKLHGLFVETEVDKNFRRALLQIPDQSDTFESFQVLPDTLHLFTDGSGTDPSVPSLRLVAWSVCLAQLPGSQFSPVAAGGVPGLIQTVLRAEVTAVISRCRFGLFHRREFYLWTDCQVVFDKVLTFTTGNPPEVSSAQKDHDLWSQLQNVLRVCCNLGLFRKILKVTSHQDPRQFSDIVDHWVLRGNEAADSLAAAARALLPSVTLTAHARLVEALRVRYAACFAMHTLLVNIGKIVVSEKETLRATEAEGWRLTGPSKPLPSEQVSFATLPMVLDEPETHTLGAGFSVLHRWLLDLTGDEQAVPMWLSSYQLYAHFQWHTGHLGFHYSRKTKTYEPLTDLEGTQDYNFIRSAGWFNAMIKCFANTIGEECTIQQRMPYGPMAPRSKVGNDACSLWLLLRQWTPSNSCLAVVGRLL